MPQQQQKQIKGGRNLTTSENRKNRYKLYASLHAMKGHKFLSSKEHRGCGALAKYNRRKALEYIAISDKSDGGGLWNLPFTDKTLRVFSDKRMGI
jgi:hypothetical protein